MALHLAPSSMITLAWAGWGVSWIAASVWTRRTAARAGVAEWPSRVANFIGAVLVLAPTHNFSLGPEWDVRDDVAWAMFGVIVAGIAFAWWARLHLGTLWSGSVTRKADPRNVDTGPYSIVRHPIYSGILASAFATAIVRGEAGALAGAALLSFGIWMKARLEERFLSEELGPGYAAYRARVPMLVPFLRL
ncbi:MAG: isoprenylcysteine carboxylmethyltransferase family protein [Hyphomonadaceae bacterium]|nr:isoprenylcysteine carboxylmethyltransferase family protein [Hyphomonadaceae bacterium]